MLSMSAIACRTSSVAECAVRLFRMMEQVTELGRIPIVHLPDQRPHLLSILGRHERVQHLVVGDLIRLNVVLGHFRQQGARLVDLPDLQVGLQQRVVAHHVNKAELLHLVEVLQRNVHLAALDAGVEQRVVDESGQLHATRLQLPEDLHSTF